VYWLSRPPYGRWAIAASIMVVAVYMDLTGPATETYPYLSAPAAAGQTVTEDMVEWRDVTVGVLPPYGGMLGRAQQDLAAGTPLLPGSLSSTPAIPADWWLMAADLPLLARAGAQIMITTRNPELTINGIVAEPATASSFGTLSLGMIAVPAGSAAAAAAAISESRATIFVQP